MAVASAIPTRACHSWDPCPIALRHPTLHRRRPVLGEPPSASTLPGSALPRGAITSAHSAKAYSHKGWMPFGASHGVLRSSCVKGILTHGRVGNPASSRGTQIGGCSTFQSAVKHHLNGFFSAKCWRSSPFLRCSMADRKVFKCICDSLPNTPLSQ